MARDAVLEDGDASNLAEGGEDGEEVGVCKVEVEVANIDGGL